jgi:hypothetical protein
MRTVATLLPVLLALSLAGCASTAGAPAEDPFDPQGSGATNVRLLVQNLNFSDARLFAIRPGRRTSLGVVGGKQNREFSLDWAVPEPLQIEIDLLAGSKCLTREMVVDPGDVLDLQIASVFSQTSACR